MSSANDSASRLTASCCINCQFWEREGVSETGACRRYAPRARTVDTDEYAVFPVWPKTLYDEWCGEFKNKETRNEQRD